MILERITIRNFGAIDHFESDFEDGLNVVKSRYADEIALAIRLVLGHRISSLPEYRVGRNTKIEARVRLAGKAYQVEIALKSLTQGRCLRAYDLDDNDQTKEYLYVTSHCPEQDLSDVFGGHTDKTHFRLLQYLDEDRYFGPRELSARTDRLSEIKAFRSYLKTFIKNFQPELIREGKRYELCLETSGTYAVRYVDDKGTPVFLSESEEMLFRYLCFLKTAEFWHGFEELRNLHGIKKPLIVEGFLERLDESIDVGALLQRTLRLKRQLILLTI